MSEQERYVMDQLVLAWNAFIKLDQTHPNHIIDFGYGINKCQDVIINRIVQRSHPDDFPIIRIGKVK